MAWGYIKLIQRKNKASSSQNSNKIVEPQISDIEVKIRHSLSRNYKWKINNACVEKTSGRFGGEKSFLLWIES